LELKSIYVKIKNGKKEEEKKESSLQALETDKAAWQVAVREELAGKI